MFITNKQGEKRFLLLALLTTTTISFLALAGSETGYAKAPAQAKVTSECPGKKDVCFTDVKSSSTTGGTPVDCYWWENVNLESDLSEVYVGMLKTKPWFALCIGTAQNTMQAAEVTIDSTRLTRLSTIPGEFWWKPNVDPQKAATCPTDSESPSSYGYVSTGTTGTWSGVLSSWYLFKIDAVSAYTLNEIKMVYRYKSSADAPLSNTCTAAVVLNGTEG